MISKVNYKKQILDFILFKSSFEVSIKPDIDSFRDKLYTLIKNDNSFINTFFKASQFAFSHKNILPDLYGFSPVIFEGKISYGTNPMIKINTGILPLPLGLFFLAPVFILMAYYIDINELQSKMDINPWLSLISIVVPYCYYAYKIIDVKSVMGTLVKHIENTKSNDPEIR